MKLTVVAVGQRIPAWANNAWMDYFRRFSVEVKLELKTLKAQPRNHKTIAQCLASEKERITSVVHSLGKASHMVVLDERGSAVNTPQLAQRLAHWQGLGVPVALVLGGPDGLDPSLRTQARECLRLSNLTLPHTMARVVLIEQLYRAWCINSGHPYHRE